MVAQPPAVASPGPYTKIDSPTSSSSGGSLPVPMLPGHVAIPVDASATTSTTTYGTSRLLRRSFPRLSLAAIIGEPPLSSGPASSGAVHSVGSGETIMLNPNRVADVNAKNTTSNANIPISQGHAINANPRRNPFHYNTRMDAYEVVKTIIVCALGLPLLRLAVGIVILIVLGIYATIITIGYRAVDPVTRARHPLPRWRRVLAVPIALAIRAALFLFGFHWISIKAPPGGVDWARLPRIIVSNHIGFIDGPFFAYYLRTSIAMKADLAQVPILGRIIQTTQPILIDRHSPEGRRRAMQDINDHLADPAYPPLLIFPEGTTSSQDYLTKFKVGSFASGLPCQPVVLRYPFKHFDISWTPDASALYLFCRMLCQFYNRLEVEFLPPYHPTEHERANPEVYAENVRQLMARTLNVECTNHAFEDVALLMQVGKYADEHVVPITDVGEVSSLTSLRSGDIQKLVQYFIKHDLDRDGLISLDELQQLFPGDKPELLLRLFNLLDTDGNGQIDFRELCVGLAALNPSRQSDELMQFAFQLYDLDNNGVIDKQELEHMLSFIKAFYGLTGADGFRLPTEVETEIELTPDGHVTFAAFREFMRHHPTFLGHAKSKLEALRGSFRVDESPKSTTTRNLTAIP